MNKYVLKCDHTHTVTYVHISPLGCHLSLRRISGINFIPFHKLLKSMCATVERASFPREHSSVRCWGETLPAWESQEWLRQAATDRRPVWSLQCLPFQGSHLIDGSCHVLNRSIFLPPLRMLRLDCKQTCCWVTLYHLPLHVSLDVLEETSCPSTFFYNWKCMSATVLF